MAPKCKDGETNTCFMFMFRSRRTNLIKRLWKARVKVRGNIANDSNETECETENNQPRSQNINNNQFLDNSLNSDTNNSMFDSYMTSNYNDSETVVRTQVLKKLKDHQLEMLLVAVESGGADLSDCVLVQQCGDDNAIEAHVRCCQVWRWPGLRHQNELKRLPMCGSAKDPVYICCNPYHWSRLCQPGTFLSFY